MSKSIKVKELEIGQGMPKVCVSVTGRTEEELLKRVKEYKELDIDILEWRVDYFEEIENIEKVKDTLKKMHNILQNKPLIFTFRSKKEGGERLLSTEYYFKLNKEIIETQLVDIVDIELFTGHKEVEYLVKKAHDNKVKTIISNHDFDKTPEEEEIVKRIEKMITLGGDFPKIAVMPNSEKDVLNLLGATSIIKNKYKDKPIVTMSMGSLGLISRLSGEIFGSAITFGCVGKPSAPGQIYYKELKDILYLINKNK